MTIQDHSKVPCLSTLLTGSNGSKSVETGSQVIPEEGYVPKIRKPYTITKQREIWTEEEHKRFLEALKLHGRAWSKIKEHVGTKTAVQIRSHAQKFFTKVLRESNKSNSVESIEIPPPRPKRKPTYPYPRNLVLPAKKGASLNSSYDQENQSPTSVLSALASDNLGSEDSNTLYGSCSTLSTCCEGFNHGANMTSEDEPSAQQNVSESNEPADMKLQLLPKDEASETFEATIFTKRLRLFGKDLTFMDGVKPSTSSASSSILNSQVVNQRLSPKRVNDAGSESQPVEVGLQALYAGTKLPFPLNATRSYAFS